MKSKHGLPSRESLHGCRGDQDNDNINGECGKNWKTTTPLDGHETCSMKKSPSLDDWRHQNCHHSLKDDWSRSQRSRIRSRSRSCSRSRSRSPVRSVRRQSDFHERNRKRSRVSTQVCKEFMAGRCKRGNQCHFLHQDIQSHEDGWDNKQKRVGVSKNNTKKGVSTDCSTDYLKGNCGKGASCRFVHDGVSDGFNRGLLNEISRERETNKRNRVITPELDIKGEARKSSDTPCKYFAIGNCHNGNHCRFSHHGQVTSPECDGGVWGLTYVSLDKYGAKPTDVDASFNVEKSSKGSDADVSNETEKPLTSPKWTDADASVDVGNSCSDLKWSDTGAYSRDKKLKDTSEKMGASKPRFSNRSVDERWQHDYDICGKNSVSNVHYKRVDIDKEKGISKKIENDGANIGVSEPKHSEESIGDMEMPPEWNYRIHSSVNTENLYNSEPTHMASLPAHEKNITEKDSSQACDELSAMQRMSTDKSNFQLDHMRGNSVAALPCDSNVVRNSSVSHIDLKFSSNILPMPSFEHSGPSSSSLPHSNPNTIGQSELIPSNEVNMKIPLNNLMFQEDKPSGKLNIGDTSILHGYYGCPSAQNMVTSFAKSEGPIEAVSVPTIQPCQKITFLKQYDSRSDSIEPAKRKDTNTKPSNFLVNPVSQVNTADGKPKLSANELLQSSLVGGTYGSDYHNDHSPKHESDFNRHKPNHLEPVANSEVKENGVVKTKKADMENKNGLSENIDAYDRTEEGRKNKDGKEIRAFKFALVEFVKDLLKPTWKEGQIGKEAYKSIVKKVVDKVTATMQVTNIPQTPEKIDQYLSFSKPKLSKLVQAYVENLQKS